eukprot:5139572-Pyramimonas_sp.AAC.1
MYLSAEFVGAHSFDESSKHHARELAAGWAEARMKLGRPNHQHDRSWVGLLPESGQALVRIFGE